MAKKKNIYLAGAIECFEKNNMPEKYLEWRKKVTSWLEENTDMSSNDPTKFFVTEEEVSKNGETFHYDMRLVRLSDIVLVNLDSVRLSVGTIVEIHEAAKNGKPIIGFLESDLTKEELMEEIHPWIYEMLTHVETGAGALEKSLEHILYYYQK